MSTSTSKPAKPAGASTPGIAKRVPATLAPVRDAPRGPDGLPRQNVLGVPVAAVTMTEAVALCEDAITRRERLLIGVVNAAKLVHMRDDIQLNEAVRAADVILADGMAVVWASRVLGEGLPERVAGIDLMTELLARGNQRGWRFFLLGAKQDVLDQVIAQIRRQFPHAQVAGSHHGYFGTPDEPCIVAQLAASQADVLFVAMSSPKKEVFLGRWAGELNVPVCHGVGGAFDVLAGVVQRAPRLWQRLGLEWLYRVLQEPGRLWKRYLVTNTRFVWMVLKARVLGN